MNIITIVPIDRERKILPINQVPVWFYNISLYLSKRYAAVIPKGLLKEEDERGKKVVLPKTDSTSIPMEEVGDILGKIDYFSDDVYVFADSLLFDRFSRISNAIVVCEVDTTCNDPNSNKLVIDKGRFEELVSDKTSPVVVKKGTEYHRRIKFSKSEYELTTALLGKNIEMSSLINWDGRSRLELCKAICGEDFNKDLIIKIAGEISLRNVFENEWKTTVPSMVDKELVLVPSFGFKDVILNKEDYVDLKRQDAELQGDTLFIIHNHTMPLHYESEPGGGIWKISHLIDLLCKRNREEIDKV